MSQAATFTLNDEPWAWRPGLTVEDLLRTLDATMPIAVVRIGGQHVARRDWATRRVAPGDQVRVVYIIAGG